MRNKKIILTCAIIIAIASFFSYLINKEDIEAPLPLEVNPPVVIKKIPSPAPSHETLPNFVAGRPSLVEKAKKIYDNQKHDDESKRAPSSGKKILKDNPFIQLNSFHLTSVNVSFAHDLYACVESNCSPHQGIAMGNGFVLIKGNPATKINSTSTFLVTQNMETKQFGVWEKRVIIELKDAADFGRELNDLKFTSIENPQPKLYIAEYNGEVSQLDSTLAQIKQNPNVEDLKLEITYSKKKTARK